MSTPADPSLSAAPQVFVEREVTHFVKCERCGYVGQRTDQYDALRLREAHLREDHPAGEKRKAPDGPRLGGEGKVTPGVQGDGLGRGRMKQ